MTLKQVTEALVFASPKPLLTKEIVAALRAAGKGSEDPEVQSFAAANVISRPQLSSLTPGTTARRASVASSATTGTPAVIDSSSASPSDVQRFGCT